MDAAGGTTSGEAASAAGDAQTESLAPVEQRQGHTLFSKTFYNLATKYRAPDGRLKGKAANFTEFDVVPLPVPQASKRYCEMSGTDYSCQIVDGDEPCRAAAGAAECNGPLGHLRPIGEQWAPPQPAPEYDVPTEGPMDGRRFYEEYMRPGAPLVFRGLNENGVVTDPKIWSDEGIKKMSGMECLRPDDAPEWAVPGGQPPEGDWPRDFFYWELNVEKYKHIADNDRGPRARGFTLCELLDRYNKPEWEGMLYFIDYLNNPPSLQSLMSHVRMPSVLDCEPLYCSFRHAPKLYLSHGDTASALHLDNHENLFLQVEGNKEVWLWHPDDSAKLYMDHHEKFGLSPVHIDHVDLDRFPEFAHSTPFLANLSAGDAVYIPDGWWHSIKSKDGARNINLAYEFEPFIHDTPARAWPKKVRKRYVTAGIYWAEQQKILAEMTKRYAQNRTLRIKSDRCEAPPSGNLRAVNQLQCKLPGNKARVTLFDYEHSMYEMRHEQMLNEMYGDGGE